MRHPSKAGRFKVVIQNGFFSVTQAGDNRWPEARGSEAERRRLVARVGLQANGSIPGLVETYARTMARKMGAARTRRRSRR